MIDLLRTGYTGFTGLARQIKNPFCRVWNPNHVSIILAEEGTTLTFPDLIQSWLKHYAHISVKVDQITSFSQKNLSVVESAQPLPRFWGIFMTGLLNSTFSLSVKNESWRPWYIKKHACNVNLVYAPELGLYFITISLLLTMSITF